MIKICNHIQIITYQNIIDKRFESWKLKLGRLILLVETGWNMTESEERICLRFMTLSKLSALREPW